MCVLASMSPRSMRLASVTSCSAVSSGTRPIERRYRRSESSDGSTVRSSSGLRGGSCVSLFSRASACASSLAASLVAARPSAPTTSMPCSTRCACSSCSCSFVTSTSSRQAEICSKVRTPFSWPSVISGRSSSISRIEISSASIASLIAHTPRGNRPECSVVVCAGSSPDRNLVASDTRRISQMRHSRILECHGTMRASSLDVQAQRPTVQVSLSRVGVTDVEKVIRVRDQLYWARLECFVDLGPQQKGAHMSRFEEVVNEAIGEVVLREARCAPRTSRCRSPSSCARARTLCGPRSRSSPATRSTSRRPSRGSRRRSSTRCSGPPSPPSTARAD